MAITRTVRKESAGVVVRASAGERLEYSVTVRGPDAVFALVDSTGDRVLLSNADLLGNSAARNWPLPVDTAPVSTNHNLALAFHDAIKYTYLVRLHRAAGAVIINDIDYESLKPEPAEFQNLLITTF